MRTDLEFIDLEALTQVSGGYEPTAYSFDRGMYNGSFGLPDNVRAPRVAPQDRYPRPRRNPPGQPGDGGYGLG